MQLEVDTPEATQALGQSLAPQLQPGDVILLDGDLGAGKTTFTQGLAVGLGVKRHVKSPTFTIIREYQGGRLPLYHMDVYRLEDGSGDELGLQEYFNGDGVSVVEWSQFVQEDLPATYLRLQFTRRDDQGESARLITISGVGSRYQALVANLEDRHGK